MKKTLKVFAALLCCIGFSMVLPSCKDDDNENQNTELVDNSADQPTEDALEVKLGARTYVFDAQYTGTGAALVRRLSDKSASLDETVQAAVVHDDCVASLSDKDYEGIIALIARGGCLVYTSATKSNMDAFIRGLQRVGKGMGDKLDYTEEGLTAYGNLMFMSADSTGLMVPPSLQLHDTNGVLCDACAFKGSDRYVVMDAEDPQDVVTLTTEVGDNDEESVTEEGVLLPTNEATPDYLYGLHADGLAAWIDAEKDEAAEKMQAATLLNRVAAENGDFMDLDKVCKAHTESYSFIAYGAHKRAPVTVLYEVWPVNDTQGTDYYLVHQSISVENSKMKCGPENSSTWHRYRVGEFYGSNTEAYHAYMADVKNEVKFQGGKAHLDHASPINTIGSSSFSEGTSWSLSASFVNPNLSGSVSMSKSYTYSVSDLKMVYTKNGSTGSPKWEYMETSKPKLTATSHGQCKDIQKLDADFDYCWIWRVENANSQYSFQGITTIEMEGVWRNIKNHSKRGYKRFATTSSHNVTLPQPPRYAQEWKMFMLPTNNEAFNNLKAEFPDYFKSSFPLYTITANDTKEITKWIDKVSAVINANPVTVRQAFGMAETSTESVSFSLTWKLLEGKDNFATRQFTIPPVN